MASEARASRTPRWVASAWVFGVATLLGVIAASEHYVSMRAGGHEVGWDHALAWRLPYWYLWALFAPVVAALARRFPLARHDWARRVAGHIAFALALSLVHTALQLSFQRFVAPSFFRGSFSSAYAEAAPFWPTINLLAYGALLGVTYATDFSVRYREREIAASRLATQLARAELHALRLQLKPHFLFNAMNSIAMLVRQGERGEAVRMIAGLGDLLSVLLEEDRHHEVALRDELDFLRRYLDIERVRFGDRLRVEVSADETVLAALVPSLILQPLVENAIRHGIARSAAAGRLAISARRVDDWLELEVCDDGPGLEPSALGDGTGVGLRNTRARLEQLYGSRHSFELRNAPTGGARATFRVPYHVVPVATVA